MSGITDLNSGVVFGLITMVTWGWWLVFADFASESVDPVTAAAISYLVATALTVAYAVVSDASLAVTAEGGLFAVAAGVFAATGLVATYVGLSVGSTATVSTVGALYFVVAAVIGMAVLGDAVTLTKAAGVAFAVVALVLITR